MNCVPACLLFFVFNFPGALLIFFFFPSFFAMSHFENCLRMVSPVPGKLTED